MSYNGSYLDDSGLQGLDDLTTEVLKQEMLTVRNRKESGFKRYTS